jgi:hypothetical protein
MGMMRFLMHDFQHENLLLKAIAEEMGVCFTGA